MPLVPEDACPAHGEEGRAAAVDDLKGVLMAGRVQHGWVAGKH